jgi:hypothetical protein
MEARGDLTPETAALLTDQAGTLRRLVEDLTN